jgi:hypothetical protein
MVSSEELIGTTEELTLYARCRINRCRYNRVRLHYGTKRDRIVITGESAGILSGRGLFRDNTLNVLVALRKTACNLATFRDGRRSQALCWAADDVIIWPCV